MKTKNLKSLLILFAIMFHFSVIAQDKANRKIFGENIMAIPKNDIIRCVSSEYEKSLQKKFNVRSSNQDFENWLVLKLEDSKNENFRDSNTIITIPVVVHVIHNGDAVGSNENISDARVLSQITVLNQDFRRMLDTNGYNKNSVGADVGIEFCLVSIDPNGNATNGIDRVNLGTANWATESSVENTLKPQTQWDPYRYFNIWVCQFSNSPSAELNNILGYAQFPSNATLAGIEITDRETENTDGVIIDYRCFGSKDIAPATASSTYYTNYDLGRTATHEIGHCLGLRHIWGDNSSCVVNATDSYKDYCLDTPAAANENYDCSETYDSCSSNAGNDMVENYMNYTNDSCMNTFTQNQKDRILTVLEYATRRASLKTSSACGTLSIHKNALEGLNLYPNPASNYINLTNTSNAIEHYTITNTLGQIVQQDTVMNSDRIAIPISNLTKGLYMITVQNSLGSKSIKFIKN